ncbi:MAG: MFS transporter [Candidatus Thermoplasmatota archaeon]|nr:MFS transporter [Candidatus Thermoplasmatota archaeon]
MTAPGYIPFLRQNRSFRRLFISDLVMFTGDWFSVIAMFLLAAEATDDSPLAIAGVLVARSFTFAPLEPITGMLADRYSRRGLMLASNLLSFCILTAFLALDMMGSLVSVYLLAICLVVGRAVYDPAQTAYLPNVCTKDELLTANALVSGVWSASMGFGCGIGGLVISEYGIEVGLMIDSVTFLFAALMIYTLPHGGPDQSERKSANPVEMFGEIFAGWRYILARPHIRRLLLAKGGWATGGGAQVFLLILIGMEAGFGEVAAGIGVVYLCRGFGSGFGPIVARPLMAVPGVMPYLIGFALTGAGLLYVGVSTFEWGEMTLLCIFLSHGCSGISWVFSTTHLQRRSDDEWMGRVAGTDNLIITLTMGVSTFIAGIGMEYEVVTLREMLLITAGIQISVGVLWLLLASPGERAFFTR